MTQAINTSQSTMIPRWITPARIAEAKAVYGRKLHRTISDAEAVEIIVNIANLMNALTNPRRHS